jgi:hypothetical protein
VQYDGLEILIAMAMSSVFWDVTLCLPRTSSWRQCFSETSAVFHCTTRRYFPEDMLQVSQTISSTENFIFWNITPRALTDVSEAHVASIFWVEELAKQETRMKQKADGGFTFLRLNGLNAVISQKIELILHNHCCHNLRSYNIMYTN